MKNHPHKSYYKLILLGLALLIGVTSLVYTDYLIKKLADRERKLILLYARGLEFLVNTEDAENISFIFSEIIEANKSIPVILTDGLHVPIQERNVPVPAHLAGADKQAYLQREVYAMQKVYPPIEVEYSPGFRNYIYYRDSNLITQLKYYPYVQLSAIAFFTLMGYMVLSYSRRMEQNRVWVGLAKETAHQLGTPLSSLMAWITYFRSDERFADDPVIDELEKDVHRLEVVTARFSNIGSVPTLRNEPIADLVWHVLDYLRLRISTKVHMTFENELAPGTLVRLNRPLFEWVIENLVKNAVDAMSGVGQLTIRLAEAPDARLTIDVTDTGKGIAKSQLKRVFEPGFTTKKRGWGLGLTLVRRIVRDYHGGRIFVRYSEPGKGTTFRIVLGDRTTPADAESATPRARRVLPTQ